MTAVRRAGSHAAARTGLGLASLALAALLLLGFRAPQDGALARTSGSSSGGAGTGSSSTTSGGSTTTGSTTTGGGSSTTSGSSGTASGQQTYDGSVVNTRYGPVQVEITVSGGKITAVTAIELPSGGRSGAISSYVEPILSSEALSAQSASIDLVSGATYTSEAYARSLQAALDQAGL